MSIQPLLFGDIKNKILKEVNLSENTSVICREKCHTLDDLSDILIVQKIKIKEPTEALTDLPEAKECLCFTTECDCEKKWLIEEQEAIIKKQLQLLQADERGKLALVSEIAALKQRQEQKVELLKNRQRALDIEKQRARKVANLPPPLPKSVKSLLKISDDEPTTSKPDIQMPEELITAKINLIEPRIENKENIDILDPEELEARCKMEEERQMKAKKRFNEALKKDRQKEEYSNIMKHIQTAELQNRREMAKNLSSDTKGIPCPISDKLQTSKKQTDMEEATEKLFKKNSIKEHAIEDIEGYQDHYETKYEKIDSDFESKMIDCIPKFIKDNYEYLLEDESKFQGGKNFSVLEDDDDVFNKAYIETSPAADELDGKTDSGGTEPGKHGSYADFLESLRQKQITTVHEDSNLIKKMPPLKHGEKIDLAITHLDKLRSNIQTEYEQTLKPLLVTPIEVHKKDKAVETESIKSPSVDKAVETDMQFEEELTSPLTPPTFDFKTSGVMAYKRRHYGPKLCSFKEMIIPDMHKRDILYTVHPGTFSEGLISGSGSSTSYCSLPSKHGLPSLSSATESSKCDICIAEIKDEFARHVPHEPSPGTACAAKHPSTPTMPNKKASLSQYVQQLAKKYLVAKSTSPNYIEKKSSSKVMSNSNLPIHSKREDVGLAFEKEVICKSNAGLFVESQNSKEFIPTPRKEIVEERKPTYSPSLSDNKPVILIKPNEKKYISDSSEIPDDKVQHDRYQDDIYKRIKSHATSESPVESDFDLEAKRIQAIHQVLSRRFPRFTHDLSSKPTETKGLKEEKEPEFISSPMKKEMLATPHVYHELSTIQELDSALTGGSLQMSHSKLSDTIETNGEKEPSLNRSQGSSILSAEKLKMVSLLEPPDSEISELAKSIHFVAETQKNEVQPLQTPISSESLTGVSITSKDDLSLPSHVTDTNSSSSSQEKILSSTLTGNHKISHLKHVKQLPQFSENISNIDKSFALKKSLSLSVSSSSESIPRVSVCSSNHSIPSVVAKKSTEEDKIVQSIISGYLSDLEMPQKSQPDISYPLLQMKDAAPLIASGYISDIEMPEMSASSGSDNPMVPQTDKFSPSVIAKSILNFERDVKRAVPSKDSYFKCIQIPGQASSDSNGSLKPMSLHSNISSPSSEPAFVREYGNPDFSESAESFKPMTLHSNISSPGESSLLPRRGYPYSATSVDSFKPMSVHSNISSPSSESVAAAPNDRNPDFAKSVDSFKPMSLHSNISSPSSESVAAASNDRYPDFAKSANSFKPMSLHSNISSPSSESIVAAPNHRNLDFAKSVDSFKPMSLHSNISSPSESAPLPTHGYPGFMTSADDFKLMSLHSNISSPSELAAVTPKYQNSGFVSSSGSFKALTAHSTISSPSELVVCASEKKHQDFTSNAENFNALTPHSNISPIELAVCTPEFKHQGYGDSSERLNNLTSKTMPTPHFPQDEIELKRKIFSSRSSEFHPMTIRLDISTSSISSDSTKCQSPESKKFSSLRYHLAIKTLLSKSPNNMLPLNMIDQEGIPGNIEKKKQPKQDFEVNVKNNKKEFNEIEAKQNAHPCSSDFFIPHIKNLSGSKTKNGNCDIVEGNLSSECDAMVSKLKSTSDSGMKSVLFGISENQEILPEMEHFDARSIGFCEEITKSTKENPGFEKSENLNINKDLEFGRAFKKQYSSLQAISSTSSSTENLSEISESKVVCQSTPVKNFSELILEPGILDEPDLTLYATQMSIKVDSPVKKRYPLTSIMYAINEEDNTIMPSQSNCKTPDTIITSQSNFKTPDIINPQQWGSAETPSMMSFLKHEVSCLNTESTVLSLKDPNIVSNQSNDETPKLKEVKRSQFQGKDLYRQRTKRLWNNLTEVRKKVSEDEKKKNMKINRLKAKEYAKKLTPKRK